MSKTSKPTRKSRPSSASRPPSSVALALAAVARAAREDRSRWYLFGAQAVIAWGAPRATADIDVTVEADAKPFTAAMARAGFTLRVAAGDAEAFVARTRVLPFAHEATGLPVDVVLAGPGLEETFLAAVRNLRIGRVTVPVIAPEDLVVTKILAGRPKDLEDVRALLRLPELPLDRRRIRALLSAVEAALGQADLLPVFERLSREARPR